MLIRSRLTRAGAVAVLAAAVAVGGSQQAGAASASSQWPMFGQNLNNTASTSTIISTSNVKALSPKWAFTTGGDVSARAAVVNGVAYVPDWSGHLYAIKASSGKLIWSKNILDDYLPDLASPTVSKVVSRTSPAVDAATGTVYIGTQKGAYLLAINAATGALRWRTQLDGHAYAIETASPVVVNGVVYTGVASLEEAVAAQPDYKCCSFRGSAVAVNATTGAIIWKTYTVPDGYNGGAVWGSSLVPDTSRGLVYVTTGNNYSACTSAPACDSPDNHVDSVLALSMNTGAISWADRLASTDDWNVACFSYLPGTGNCPAGAGPDYDFGSGVNLITVQTPQGPRTILGAGQKSGIYSAFDPSTGALLWGTKVGPGSALGGMEWGSASDGKRIYVGVGNLYGIPYTLPNGQTDYAGSWAALDPLTGKIIWQVADPNGALDLGPMTVANGVVYAPSMAGDPSAPNMFALDAATGATDWSYASGASVIAGASIANDTVYWGSGYANLGIPGFTGNNKLYAFTLGGQ